MDQLDYENKKEQLRKIIEAEGIARGKDGTKIVSASSGNMGREGAWLFDFRNIFLKTEPMNLIVELFWHYLENEFPFQIGGQEIAAIPFISTVVFVGHKKSSINGFIIRKARKPSGLQKIIEGTLTDEKIVLVDDLINSAATIKRQIQNIEDEGKKVALIFVIVRFRNEEYYKFLEEKNIRLISIFTLDDFALQRNFSGKRTFPNNFKKIWHCQNPNPNYFLRVPKSAPVIDEKNVYIGTDNEEFIAVDQKTGALVWKFKIGKGSKGKSILSTPAICGSSIYFGAYDGNFYALDKEDGKLIWRFEEADWIGSSPAVAEDLGLVFIGLEFGLFRKKGGIVAINNRTGEKKWDFTMPGLVHSSPAYCKEKKVVAIGSNNNQVYLFDAASGKLKWTFQTNGEVKMSFAFDIETNTVIFGSFDNYVYILDIDSGKKVGSFKAGNIFYTTPIVYAGNAFIGSNDKCLYNLNLRTGEINWIAKTSGRIFANPVIVDDNIYIGATDGRLYEIDIKSGKIQDIFQTTERITNQIAYNKNTERFFVSTYANEIYCLKKI